MDARQFLDETLRPTLEKMDMHSPAAEKLLLMTACHESGGFVYDRQVGGPALSYYQIEPATLNDLYGNYLGFRPERQALLDQFMPEGSAREDALMDAVYATAAARLIYTRVPEALPDFADDEAMGRYCKKYWNTEAGKATPEKYINDWLRYKPDDYA